MDAANAAAIAALIVSIMAMTVAFAQAIQQYLITGQLIRMCDSVVYGKMPGQGRRVWEVSQFRFRVVYSVPQISLRPSLWMDGLPHHSSYTKGHLPLPDLRHSTSRADSDFCRALSSYPIGQKQSPYSAVPGEASWVSFCRVAQYSSGNDVLYEMVNGDADRCPSDLPVVPMQVSMRDIVAIALMTGMTCTDASFEKKTLAMEGFAGTITSSWHPILGALIHFAPRNSNRPQGLRVGDGSVHPNWMARMWDVIVVAGRQYTLRERRYYEVYEGYHWVSLSRDRTVAKISGTKFSSRASSPAMSFRSRTNSTASIRSILRRSSTSASENIVGVRADAHLEQDSDNADIPLPRSPHDGDWSFEAEESEPTTTCVVESLPKTTQTQTHRPSSQSNRPWYERWSTPLHKHFATGQSPTTDLTLNSYVVEVENYDAKEKSKSALPEPVNTDHQSKGADLRHDPIAHIKAQPYPSPTAGVSSARKMQGSKPLDGWVLQKYIEEMKKAESISPRRGRLLLPWHTGEGEEVDVKIEEFNDWRSSYIELKRERSMSYAERWRDIVDMRQKRREERDLQEEWEITSHRSTRPSSVGADERPRRQRSTGSRSISRDSQRSRTSGYSLRDHNHVQPRGRSSEQSPRTAGNWQRFPSEESVGPNNIDYSRAFGLRERSNAPGRGDSIEYGDDPILVPQHLPGQKKNEREFPTDDNVDKAGKQKPSVVFQLDERSRSPPSPPSDREDPPLQEKVDMVLQMLKTLLEHDTESKTNKTSSDRESSASERETHTPRYDSSQDQDIESEIEHDEESEHKNIEIVEPEQPMYKPMYKPPKGILKPPREQFPEELNVIRPGVAPLKDAAKKGIPPGARWTKIDRRLVNPEALEDGHERFEGRPDFVIVLRVLTREEIEEYANKTQEIRNRRRYEGTWRGNRGKGPRTKSESDDGDDWGQNYPSIQRQTSPIQTSIGSRPADPFRRDSGHSEDTISKQNTMETGFRDTDLNQRAETTLEIDSEWLSEGGKSEPNPLREMPGGLESIVDDGLTVLGTGTMRDRNMKSEKDPEASLDVSGSNESILGSFYDSRISESPTMVSESEEDKASVRFVRQPFEQDQRGGSDRARNDSDNYRRFEGRQTSDGEDGTKGSGFHSRERGRRLRSPSPRPHGVRANSRRVRTEFASPRTTNTTYNSTERSRSPRPKSRRRSTDSTISLPERPQSDEDDWEAIGFQGRDRKSQLDDSLAIQAGNDCSVDDADAIDDQPTDTGDGSPVKGTVNWLWICQADVVPGYFATPWQSHFSESTCFGAITVMLEALDRFTEASTLRYVERLPHCESWVYQGKGTHPSYAINAMGGIIVSTKYKRVKFPTFATSIPPIELLRPDERQVNRSISSNSNRTIVECLAELMALDSWLSFCGRLPEICNGRNNLVRGMPALVQKIMSDFEYEFQNVDRTATEGGWQIIKEMADLVLHELEKLTLDDGERLFTIVAVLRAAKMALCVVQGPSTVMLRDILLRDVQVYVA